MIPTEPINRNARRLHRTHSYKPAQKRPSTQPERADVPARVLTPVISVEETQEPAAEDKHDGCTTVVAAPGMVRTLCEKVVERLVEIKVSYCVSVATEEQVAITQAGL